MDIAFLDQHSFWGLGCNRMLVGSGLIGLAMQLKKFSFIQFEAMRCIVAVVGAIGVSVA